MSMHAVYFISDTHLSPQTPHIMSGLISTLKGPCRYASSVYILGDFLDRYIGIDEPQHWLQPLIFAFKSLSKTCDIFIMPGNRDFLMSQAFCDTLHAKLCSDPCVVQHFGKTFLLTHGDMFCKSDKKHQYFRRLMHQNWLQKRLLNMSLKTRQSLANSLREKSKKRHEKSKKNIDLDPKSIEQLIIDYPCDAIIHGHTHAATDYHDHDVLRYALGDWHEQAAYLKLDASGLTWQYTNLNNN